MTNQEKFIQVWNGYLGIHRQLDKPMSYADNHMAYTILSPITTTDVAMMMALLKIARIKNGGGTGDSFVDLAGYAACGGELNALASGKEKIADE